MVFFSAASWSCSSGSCSSSSATWRKLACTRPRSALRPGASSSARRSSEPMRLTSVRLARAACDALNTAVRALLGELLAVPGGIGERADQRQRPPARSPPGTSRETTADTPCPYTFSRLYRLARTHVTDPRPAAVLRVYLVAAVAANGIIGANGKLPWHIPGGAEALQEADPRPSGHHGPAHLGIAQGRRCRSARTSW